MAERDVTRNGRGQIVSQEISGVSDSTQDTLQYGKVFLPTFENGSTKVEKLNRQSFEQHIDTSFSDDLLIPDVNVTPEININEIIQQSDYTESDLGDGGSGNQDDDQGEGGFGSFDPDGQGG